MNVVNIQCHFFLHMCAGMQGGSDSPADGGGGERPDTFRGKFRQRSPQDHTSFHHI